MTFSLIFKFKFTRLEYATTLSSLSLQFLFRLFDCIFSQKENGYHPYSMDQVRHISYQLVKACKCKSFK